MDLHQRLAQYSGLDCQVAKRFSTRPALIEVASTILREQWSARRLSAEHDPLSLYLVSQAAAGRAWIRPLAQVLVERYCLRRTLNLVDGEDSLCTRQDGDPSAKVIIDLHGVELLINQCAPFLLETYKQALASYWSRFDRNGQTPWGWYAQYLQEQFKLSVEEKLQDASLSPIAISIARELQQYPDLSQRQLRPEPNALKVSLLAVDFSPLGFIDVDLASAVLIENNPASPEQSVHLLFTLGSILYPVTSREAMLKAIARHWPVESAALSPQVTITPSLGQVFEEQAVAMLHQQLRLIDQLAPNYHSSYEALTLGLDLDRLTAMLDLCNGTEAQQRQALINRLPDWLRNAPSSLLIRYSTLLLDVAQGYQHANGKFWMHGVDTAEQFANRKLAARFALDHPGNTLAPEQVKVINYQTIAAATPAQGAPLVTGEVIRVELSLAQLAIGNLGLLKPGRVELRSNTDQALPSWMTEAYLRTLVSQLDIATSYPQLLANLLLHDPASRQERARLLGDQLRSQLPSLALELHLRGQSISADAAERIAQVFAPVGVDETPNWVMRPLGFIKEAGASPDRPLNAWLIEARQPGQTPCLLYRPLHRQSLLEFADRMALFVAISSPGELQDDLLQRLPAEDRKYYAHGGFLQPHLFYPLTDTSAVPFSTPAPVSLTLDAPVTHLEHALYQACVDESIRRFREHSSTSAQSRWNAWKELGWLLFNTLLPLAGEALGPAAWLVQMAVALADYVTLEPQSDPSHQRLALVNLLINIAILLFSHSVLRLRLEEDSPPRLPSSEPALTAPPAAIEQTSPLPAVLDFNWSRPQQALSPSQRTALQLLQSPLIYHELGPAISHGPLQGLYLHQGSFWVVLEGKVYGVILDAEQDQVRIVGQTSAQSLGPWLQRDPAGRWQLDLRLRLRGGMPLTERLRQRNQRIAQQCQVLDKQLDDDMAGTVLMDRMLKVATDLATTSAATNALTSSLESTRSVSAFWSEHVRHAEARNALAPLRDYVTIRAHALRQDSLCLQVIELILRKLWRPKREQLLGFAQRQQAGEELNATELGQAGERLNEMMPLLEERISNLDALSVRQQELGRMASRTRTDIAEAYRQACHVNAGPEKSLSLHFLRLEALVNRIILVHSVINYDAAFWLQRCWTNLQLGISQRLKLFQSTDLGEEVQVRLLRSIDQQFRAAKRQLGNLTELYKDAPAAIATLGQLNQALESILEKLAQDLGELPNYPPTTTLAQLRRQLPGLIETSEHGLLLGETDAEDSNVVDIAGVEGQGSTQTYRLEHGAWREVTAPAAPAPDNRQPLTQLLTQSTSLMADARQQVAKLALPSASNYLPVELEELVQHQRDRLRSHIAAIEQRLTEHNQVDEAHQGLSATEVTKALDSLASEFEQQALALRTRAALAQPPRMAEVQYLVEHGQVTIRRIPGRRHLAKIKGRPDDFLDEYAIEHQQRTLWYAHFHYATNSTAKPQFTAGHLKTAAQRHMAGQQSKDPATGRQVAVYRAPITSAAAQQYFFGT